LQNSSRVGYPFTGFNPSVYFLHLESAAAQVASARQAGVSCWH